MKLKRGDEIIWEIKTSTKTNCNHPQWNENYFLDLPLEGWAKGRGLAASKR